MSKQPKALRLAELLERMSLSTEWDKQAAAELRRLHAKVSRLTMPLTIPPEAKTRAEQVAYCAGWWDALFKIQKSAESHRATRFRAPKKS